MRAWRWFTGSWRDRGTMYPRIDCRGAVQGAAYELTVRCAGAPVAASVDLPCDGVVMLPPPTASAWLHDGREPLYVRGRVHEPLWAMCKTLTTGAMLVRGNPGIGKTFAITYCAARSLAEDANTIVLVVLAARRHLLLDGRWLVSTTTNRLKWEDETVAMLATIAENKTKKLLILHDVRSAKGQELQYNGPFCLRMQGCFADRLRVVLFTSPAKENIALFIKDFRARVHLSFLLGPSRSCASSLTETRPHSSDSSTPSAVCCATS